MKKTLTLSIVIVTGLFSISQTARADELNVIHSIDFPSSAIGADLAWDGEYLWVSMHHLGQGGFTYQLDPSDGSIVSSLQTELTSGRTGLAYGEGGLWIATPITDVAGTPPDTVVDDIYRYKMDGSLEGSFSAPHSPDAMTTGAAWDGSYLWISDTRHQEIIQVDPLDGSVVTAFASPGAAPRGLAWDGDSLWSVDSLEEIIYQMDVTGEVLQTWSSPVAQPYGMTFDGTHLWILSNDDHKIHQVAIPEPAILTLLAVSATTFFALRWLQVCRGQRT